MFERCICPSRNTYISQPSSESSCNAWTMYYCLQIRVARCRRRFHLKLLAHGFLQTFPSFIQCVNAIGNYYVKICLICSEIHIWLENTVIFFTKLSMISSNNRDKSFDIVTTELATKWINRPWSVLAEFWSVHPSFFHWKKIPFSFNFRTLPFMPLTISADTYRIVYRWCGISPYYDVLPIEINKIKYDIMFSSFPKLLPIITA